jgi:sulfide:quinone oxidoreductase
MPARVVILGAGFGGLELTTTLSCDLGSDVEVTLIDRNDAFVFGFAKLDVMFGRQRMRDVRLPYRAISRPNVQVRQESVLSIDPARRRVRTESGTLNADVLVVALGADLSPEATPGLRECGYEFYTPEGAARIRAVLESFRGGRVVIGVLGGFFKCPPAPYETAFMLHDYLTRRGIRKATTIQLVTPLPKPIPVSDEVSDAIITQLDERNIHHLHSTWISHLDPTTKTAHLRNGGKIPFDLFLAVPVHVAPPVVAASGMTVDGWIPVDATTLATTFPHVYAVGDVTSAPVPRAGVIAEGEASTVADVIAHILRGGPPPPAFPGDIKCYIEMGDDMIGRVNVNFLSGPMPVATYLPPSTEGTQEKQRFAATRRRRWFALA